jgi:hypothetical protein
MKITLEFDGQGVRRIVRSKRVVGIVVLVLVATVFLLADPIAKPNHFTDGEIISASEMNENFDVVYQEANSHDTRLANLESVMVPVGAIVAWHKSLAGTPAALPSGFLECNGQGVDDTGSPYFGSVLPNLNGEARFLRGATASGTVQNGQNENHSHVWSIPGSADGSSLHNYSGSYQIPWNNSGGAAFSIGTTASGGTEARPVNMSVVWIIRIK